MPLTIERIKPCIGAVVHTDRAGLRDEAAVHAIRQAMEAHHVLVFPRIGLDDEEQLALTDRLGARVTYDFPGMEDVYKVGFDTASRGKEFVQGTYFWHIDGVMIGKPIQKATLLSARTLSDKGGQTEFASLYAAYEGLTDDEKAELNGLRAVHSLEPSMKLVFDDPTDEQLAGWKSGPHVERPIAWTHRSGRTSLVVGSSADRVAEMPVAEGRALLARLLEWAGQPAFRYTHDWQPGDLVLWDNTAVMHRVIPYPEDSGRAMHRTTIAGTEMVE